jgi:hypothetical protein
MVCIDFGDFPNNPISFGFLTLFVRKCFFSVFDFPGAMGLKKGQGQGERAWKF